MLLRAFAKINLDLRILGKRPDGFHELRTIFQTIDWSDEIHIEKSERFEFLSNAEPRDESNLAVRAVRAFELASGKQADVRIRLIKNLPFGAGLGGGSADAAVMVLGLCRLYGVEVDRNAFRSLGSDTAFFTVGGRALGTGRGDEIQPLRDQTNYWLVLVDPGFQIATAEAYSWLTVSHKTNSIEGFRVEYDPDRENAELRNDFETEVFARRPQLTDIREELLRLGAFRAALSGSGSVVFGQFTHESPANEAAGVLGERYRVKLARPLSRSEYMARIME